MINKKRTILLNTYFLFFCFAVLYHFIRIVSDNNLKMPWDITEWLINYQGGFVRRGLRGEIIYQLNNLLHIDVYTIITIITATLFIILGIILIRGFIKKGYSLFVVPFVFFLGNNIINNIWLRPDSFLLVLFAIIVYLTITKIRFHLVWINLFFIIALLIHEIFAFFTFPIIIFLLINIYLPKDTAISSFQIKNFIPIFIKLIPSFITLLIVIYFKGNQEIASLIWSSWVRDPSFYIMNESGLVSLIPTAPGAIGGLGMTMEEAFFGFTGRFFLTFDKKLYGVLMLFLTIIAIYHILSNINKLNDKILFWKPQITSSKLVISSILIFQFCSTIPLYILGFDYSRWIYFWVISSFLVITIVPENRLQTVLPSPFLSFTDRLNGFLFQLLGDSKASVILLSLFIGIPLYMWSLQGYIESNSLYIVLSRLSHIILKIFQILGIETYLI